LDKNDKKLMQKIIDYERKFRREHGGKDEKPTNPYFDFHPDHVPQPLDLDNPEHFGRAMNFISSESREEETELDGFGFDFDDVEILRIGRHAKITANGRQFSYSAMVLLGTGSGTAGIGYGIGPTVVKSVEDAEKNSYKNLLSIKFF